MGCSGKNSIDKALAVDHSCNLEWFGEVRTDGRKIWRCSRELCQNFIFVDPVAHPDVVVRRWHLQCNHPRVFACGTLVEWVAQNIAWYVMATFASICAVSGLTSLFFCESKIGAVLSISVFYLSLVLASFAALMYAFRESIKAKSCQRCTIRKIILNRRVSIFCPTWLYRWASKCNVVEPTAHVRKFLAPNPSISSQTGV